MINNQDKSNTMLHAPIKPLILRLAAPAMVSMLITTIYNASDAFFIGLVSSAGDNSATGAIGVMLPLMSIIQAVGFFFGHGSGNFISRAFGRGEGDRAKDMASTGFFSAMIVGLLVGLLGLLFISPLVDIAGATATIKPYAIDYAKYIMIGMPFYVSSLVLNNQLRFEGCALYSMVGITTGGLLNIGLDAWFILGLGMGTAGAGLATMIGQTVSFIILVCMKNTFGMAHLSLKNFKPSADKYKEMFRGGIPSMCRQGLSAISGAVLCHVAGTYAGDAGITAMTVVNKILGIGGSLLIGFGQGFQPVCGFNFGAGNYDRVKGGFNFCVRVTTIFLLFMMIISEIWAEPIVGLFTKNSEAITYGALALRLQGATLPLAGYIVMSNMALQTMGYALRATILAGARQGLVLIPVMLILPLFVGMLGVQSAQAIADIVSIIVSMLLMRSVWREFSRSPKVTVAE